MGKIKSSVDVITYLMYNLTITVEMRWLNIKMGFTEAQKEGLYPKFKNAPDELSEFYIFGKV